MQHRVVIRQRRPWRRALGLTFALALATCAGYFAWTAWRANVDERGDRGGSQLQTMREERRRLVRELRAARAALAELQGRSTFESRGCQIDAQACEAVRASVAGLEAEVADLREQLAFYRSVVAPEQSQAGVRVLRLGLSRGASERIWRYDLVLVQPVRRDRVASGTYDLRLEGLQDQRMKTLGMDELLAGEQDTHRFSFRSFQEFAGELRLPAGFLPSRLTVTLSVRDGRSDGREVSESFDWSRLTAAGGP